MIKFFFKSSRTDQSPRPYPPSLQQQFQAFERHGISFLAQLATAIKEESWKLRLLYLAWTAGPVTYLALLIGFWLGYGKRPPRELFIYFGGYTIITGLISVFAGIVHRVTVAARRKQIEKLLSEVIAKIPDIIISIRNLRIFALTQEKRRLRGAVYLLGDPDATEASIETAVEDLTGNVQLARRCRRLEAYRKKGLWGLLRDEQETIRSEFKILLTDISRLAPYPALLLENRISGRIPSKRFGQRRHYGFMKRTIRAIEADRPDHLQLADAEDLLKLILELLMDRCFIVFRWKLSGSHPLVASSRKIEKLTLQRRMLERKRRFAKYEVILILDKIVNRGSTPLQSEKAWDRNPALDNLNASSPFTMASMPDFNALDELFSYRGEYQEDLREKLKAIQRITKEIRRLHDKVIAARLEFSDLREKYGYDLSCRQGADEEMSIRVKFERDRIRFSHRDKIHFSRHLHYYLANLTTNRERTGLLTDAGGETEQEAPRQLTEEKLKGIVLRIFAELERLIDLSEEAVSDSMEASAGINVGAIEHNLSRRTKIGWLQSLVEEMEEDENVIALRTAQRLVNHFHTPLPLNVARSLSSRYNLSLEGLLALTPARQNQHSAENQKS